VCRLCRCVAVSMCRCVDVSMCRCVDVSMYHVDMYMVMSRCANDKACVDDCVGVLMC
jgi:hypothetical protein